MSTDPNLFPKGWGFFFTAESAEAAEKNNERSKMTVGKESKLHMENKGGRVRVNSRSFARIH
jgi:hypothetical protein